MVRNQLDSRGSLARGDSIGTDHTPEEIVDALGLHRSEIEWRKEFIGFSTADARHLENLAPIVEANEAEFVNGFLEPLFETEKTKEIADRSPRDNAALQAIVSAYYKTLTGGDYGPEYFKHRTRIGMLHDKLEMPLHYFAGMFANLTTTAIDLLVEDLQSTYQNKLDPEKSQMANQQVEETAAALKAVVRILNLDMQVVNDTYLYSFTESLRGEIKATQQMRETVSASIDTARVSSTQVRGNATEM